MAMCRMRQGASAILAEQLDASMGGTPQEHRELQGQESQDFQQLFKDGIRYLSGGAASGFHHVEDAPHQATLAQIKVGQLAPPAAGPHAATGLACIHVSTLLSEVSRITCSLKQMWIQGCHCSCSQLRALDIAPEASHHH